MENNNNLYKTLYKNLIKYLEEQSILHDTDYEFNHYQRILDVAQRQKEELLNGNNVKSDTPGKEDYLSYEEYKRYLNMTQLTSQEYEERIKAYCKKHNI